MGTPHGTRVQVQEGDALPPAPFGWTWRRVTETRVRSARGFLVTSDASSVPLHFPTLRDGENSLVHQSKDTCAAIAKSLAIGHRQGGSASLLAICRCGPGYLPRSATGERCELFGDHRPRPAAKPASSSP